MSTENKNNLSVNVIGDSPDSNEPTRSWNNLVDINSRGAIFKKKNFYRRTSIFLSLLVIILLIGFIIALYDYITTRRLVRSLRICTSEECLRSAANLKLSMDLSVNPCDDFYKFSCGQWTREHPNHGWYPHFSSFETVDERISIEALKFLTSNSSATEPLPVRQSRDLYLSCMNRSAMDKLGFSVAFNYLKQVNLPLVPSFFNNSKSINFTFDWIKTEVAIKKMFAMDTTIGFMIDADIYNRSNAVIYMGTPGTSCPLPSIVKSNKKYKKTMKYANEDEDEEKLKAREEMYKNIIKKIIKTISVNASNNIPDDDLLENAASSIWNITKDLEELAETNTTGTDLQFYKMKVDELQNLTDQFLINNQEIPTPLWRRYLTLLFDGVANVTLDLNDKDFVYIPLDEMPYLPRLALYFETVPDLVLELYMWWVTVYAMILSTTTEMREFVIKETQSLSEINVYRSRSLDCADLVIDFMGLAVSYGIADTAFLDNTKPKVEHMLKDIKKAFLERVVDLNWMDKKTKKLTLQKSKEMISFIGFPEWLLEPGALEIYYGNLTMHNDTFLENMMEMIKTAIPLQLELLREVNERTWRTDPTTVNAYNYFSDNSITVPMAILTYPFYNLGLEVLNYGAIGTVLGHELTHGFDNLGRQFDKLGNYKQWWSNQTIQTFEEKTKCFINQYGNYTIPPIEPNIDGQQTLGENLADNGGLHHAFLAYKHYVKKHGEEPQLPGFESFTNLQLFFIAFGSIWCETPNTDALKYQIQHDEHCPSSIRVLGTLQNSHEFSEVFKCRVGSNMNPNRTRCRIW